MQLITRSSEYQLICSFTTETLSTKCISSELTMPFWEFRLKYTYMYLSANFNVHSKEKPQCLICTTLERRNKISKWVIIYPKW